SPFSVPSLVNAITRNIEVAEGGHKLQGKEVYDYALFAYGLPSGHFFQDRIENVVCSIGCQASTAEIQKAVSDFTTPDVESSTTGGRAGCREREGAPGAARALRRPAGSRALGVWATGSAGGRPAAESGARRARRGRGGCGASRGGSALAPCARAVRSPLRVPW